MDTIKWLIEYVRGEWRVLKGAPAAVFLLIVIASGIVFSVEEWHYSESSATLHATIENKQSLIDQLQAEQKGLSPQLAAMQARRLEIRSKLLAMYSEAGGFLDKAYRLENRPVAGKDEPFKQDVLS